MAVRNRYKGGLAVNAKAISQLREIFSILQMLVLAWVRVLLLGEIILSNMARLLDTILHSPIFLFRSVSWIPVKRVDIFRSKSFPMQRFFSQFHRFSNGIR